MFDIRFIESTSSFDELARGQICIGGFVESFEVVLDYWDRTRYETQWREAAERLVNGAATSAFITSMTDPANANFLFWWPVYSDGSILHFQNSLLFLEQLESRFDEAEPYRHVAPRTTLTEDGHCISEWPLPLTSIRNWLASNEDGQSRR